MSSATESTITRIAPRGQSNRFVRYANVIFALIMHDIKNRFFGSGIGQIVMVIWPFAHIIVMLVIYTFSKRPNPYGDSLLQYSCVSIFPFICFNYISRWIVFSASSNRSFLQYPIIKPIDLLVARAMLEIVGMSLVLGMMIIMLIAMGENAMPQDPIQALCAFAATIFLALGMGFLNGVISFVVPMWHIFYILVIIASYISSGVIFVASALPEQIRTPLSYNPLLICVEWFRSAYYSDYPTLLLDRWYCLKVSLTLLTLAFVLERLLRRLI